MSGPAPGGTPFLEAAMAAAGALIVVGFLGTLGWSAWQAGEGGAPTFELRAASPVLPADGAHVEVAVRNPSAVTAAQVEIAGRLTGAGRPAETRRLRFDYVPARSERRGMMVFATDLADREVELRVESYATP